MLTFFKFHSVFILVSLFLSSSLARSDPPFRSSSEDLIAHELEFSQRVGALVNTTVSSLLHRRQEQVIKVYVHVVHAGQTYLQGFLPECDVQKQIEVLNERINPYGFRFELAEIDYIEDLYAFYYTTRQSEQIEFGMERRLKMNHRKGGYADWNIFTMANEVFTPPLGETFKDPEMDGTFLDFTTLPDGISLGFNKGITLVREFGKWAGLYRIDRGDDCNGDGDFVADTPASQKLPNGCRVNSDSCPDQKGMDAIHNYMSGSDDDCLTEFTPGQVERMVNNLVAFRDIKQS